MKLLLEFLAIYGTGLGIGYVWGFINSKKPCEHEKVMLDTILTGTGVMVNGKRVDPADVFIRASSKDPKP